MNTIKAIETVYQGNRFRSRLAAQWAVFFDAVGIRYKHMTNGYDLGLGSTIFWISGYRNLRCLSRLWVRIQLQRSK